MTERKEQSELEDIFKISLQEARRRREEEEEESSKKDDDDDGKEDDDDDGDTEDDDRKGKGEEEEEEEGGKSSMKKKKMEEETIAASSIKAHKTADVKIPAESRASTMKNVVNMMASMNTTDLNHFRATIAQFGPNKMPGATDKSAQNASSIDMNASAAVASKGPKTKMPMPKINVKEDVEEMFNGQELSEDFKEKASTIFEAAVNARITLEVASLQEQFEQELQEQVSDLTEQLTTKLDAYLDYVVENWMKENEVAIESTLRNELMEEFIDGLKGLFTEHYINVPQTKVDVLEAMASKVEELEQKLDESITENNELKSVVYEAQMRDVFESVSADLALTQKEKFLALVEGIDFDGNLETYEKKLKIVKENYFKGESTTRSSNINEETFEGQINNNVENVDPQVNRYLQAISRTVKV
jgi:hypothetical protein